MPIDQYIPSYVSEKCGIVVNINNGNFPNGGNKKAWDVMQKSLMDFFTDGDVEPLELSFNGRANKTIVYILYANAKDAMHIMDSYKKKTFGRDESPIWSISFDNNKSRKYEMLEIDETMLTISSPRMKNGRKSVRLSTLKEIISMCGGFLRFGKESKNDETTPEYDIFVWCKFESVESAKFVMNDIMTNSMFHCFMFHVLYFKTNDFIFIELSINGCRVYAEYLQVTERNIKHRQRRRAPVPHINYVLQSLRRVPQPPPQQQIVERVRDPRLTPSPPR